MNVKKCIDILMSRMGGRTAAGLRAKILDEMLLAQTMLEQAPALPWFLEVEQATAETEVGEERLPLPTDFIREVEDFNLQILGDDGELLDLGRRSYDTKEPEIDRNADPGRPSLYSMRADYIIFRPIPDAIYTVIWPTYYGKQEAPLDSEASESAWFKNVPDLMMSMSGFRVAAFHLKDPELAPVFEKEQKSAEDRLIRLVTAKQEENRSRRMG